MCLTIPTCAQKGREHRFRLKESTEWCGSSQSEFIYLSLTRITVFRFIKLFFVCYLICKCCATADTNITLHHPLITHFLRKMQDAVLTVRIRMGIIWESSLNVDEGNNLVKHLLCWYLSWQCLQENIQPRIQPCTIAVDGMHLGFMSWFLLLGLDCVFLPNWNQLQTTVFLWGKTVGSFKTTTAAYLLVNCFEKLKMCLLHLDWVFSLHVAHSLVSIRKCYLLPKYDFN